MDERCMGFLVRAFAAVAAVAIWVSSTAVASPASGAQTGTGAWRLAGDLKVARGYHVTALLADGRVLVAGGVDAGTSAEIYDPVLDRWQEAAPMQSARSSAAAGTLRDGSVVVIGGFGSSWQLLDDAERYDPRIDAWRSAGRLATPRVFATATLLPDGTLLVVGGRVASHGGHLASAERFDPDTGQWTGAGSMRVARSGHSATLLSDGRVLVTGGESDRPGTSSLPTETSEIFEPATGTWSDAAPMARKRAEHAAVLLPDGRVLVGGSSGGRSASNFGKPEIYDPRSNAWQAIASTDVGLYASAVLLMDSRVLFVGGAAEMEDGPRATVLYDPVADRWSAGPRTLTTHANHGLLLLKNGEAFVVAGTGANGTGVSRRSERFDPLAESTVANAETGMWRAAASMRRSHGVGVGLSLADGRVLMAGGVDWSRPEPVHAEVETYDPATDTWTDEPPMTTARAVAVSALLPGGQVLAAGGIGNLSGDQGEATKRSRSSELRDPATGNWSPTGDMKVARETSAWGVLGDGRVMVVGGTVIDDAGAYTVTAATEIFDPVAQTWSSAEALGVARDSHSVATLNDGRLLVAGGFTRWDDEEGSPGITRSAEIYDPSSGRWSRTGEMRMARAMQAMVPLADGRMLVAGGFTIDGAGKRVASASAELYNPATGAWTTTGSMLHPRFDAAIVRLASGEVLVLGGSDGVGALDAAELFDPMRGRWQTTERLAQARLLPTVVRLSDGRILVAGERREAVNSVEVFARSARPTSWYGLFIPSLIRNHRW